MRATLLTASLLATLVAIPAAAPQVPAPFPRPTQPPTGPPPARPADPPPVTTPAQPAAQPSGGVPTEETLGAPIYPGAQYITSYDAGRGQRFFLFGTNADFAQIVAYYRNVLRSRGDLVFAEPGTHMFDLARFREQTMAFPPSVTVKDYTWGGSLGYLNPQAGSEPARYRTVVQIVPLPPGVTGR
ncbi:hypothetical protein BH23ACI1_BH23ACI1_02020 [soil metagenome]